MISIKNVSKEYFGYPEVIHNLSLDINDGEKIAIYGVNGSGKTTILKLLSGLIEPTTGSITIDEIDIKDIHLRDRETAMVFEDLAIPKYRVIKNVIMRPFRLRGMSRADAKRKVIEVALRYNLTGMLDNVGLLLKHLESVKLAVTRAFMRETKTILIDNPLIRLDINDRLDYFKTLFDYIYESKSTIIYATDNREELKYFNGRIVILEYGYIKQIGTYDELFHTPSCVSTAKIMHSDMNIMQGKLYNREGKYYADIYDREYPLDNKLNISNTSVSDVIFGIPADNIHMTDKEGIPVELKYIRADKIALVNCLLDNKSLYCTGDGKGKNIDISMKNIYIFDLTTEKTLLII